MKRKIFIIISCIIVVGAVVAWHLHKKTKIEVPPTLVKVQTVKISTAAEEIIAVGTLKAAQDIELSAQVSGYITKVAFKDGQVVTSNEVLFQIDNAKEQANVASAQADLNFAQNKLARMQKLVASHYVSAEDIDTSQDDVDAKKSALQNAQDNLNKKTIIAPYSGTVGAKTVNIGDFVNPGQKLIELVDRTLLRVNYSVPEKYFAAVKLGQTVKITAPELPNHNFIGTVTYISPTIDPDSHTLSLEAQIPNLENILAPGLFVQVQQILNNNTQALLVPEESLVKSPDKIIVYRVVNNKAVATTVKTGIDENGYVQITSGLSANDVIVVAGQQKLNDGDTVKILDK